MGAPFQNAPFTGSYQLQILSVRMDMSNSSFMPGNGLPFSFQGGFSEDLLRQMNLPNLQNQVSAMVHSQLIQAIIEEKMKNEILMNALLMKSRLLQERESKIVQTPPQPPVEVEVTQIKKDYVTASSDNNIDDPDEPAPEESRSDTSEDSEVSSRDLRARKRRKIQKVPNQTKNIPKNFGKAIVSFIEKQQELTQAVLKQFPEFDYAQYVLAMRQRRKHINSIADLRALWLEQQNKFASPTRILSLIFLKKHSLPYIYHSRVTNYGGHIKYRYRLMEAIKDPRNFTSIKSF